MNMLAILRRAARGWWTTQDLIAIVPAYLEPQAEISKGRVLLIHTKGSAEELVIPIQYLEPGSEFSACFDVLSDDQTAAHSPAVILRSEAGMQILSRGAVTQTMFPIGETVSPAVEGDDVTVIITLAGLGAPEFEHALRRASRSLVNAD
jgi:hypothetical protein